MEHKKGDSRIAGLLKEAQMVVMQNVGIYMEEWYYFDPVMHFHGKEVFIHILGNTPVLGFVVINLYKRTVKAYDKNIELLRSWEIK